MFKRTIVKTHQNFKLKFSDKPKMNPRKNETQSEVHGSHLFRTKAVGDHSVCPCSPLFEDAAENPKRFSRILSQSISILFDPNCFTSLQSSLLGPTEMFECEGTLAYQDFSLYRLSICMVQPTILWASSVLPYPLQRAALAASLSR